MIHQQLEGVMACVLAALLEKQLRSEKKTRRQLQRRLGSVEVGNHGDGDDVTRGRGATIISPDDDGQQRMSTTSACQSQTAGSFIYH